MLRVYTFNVGYKINSLDIPITAESQEEAEQVLERYINYRSKEVVSDFWVNSVEETEVKP